MNLIQPLSVAVLLVAGICGGVAARQEPDDKATAFFLIGYLALIAQLVVFGGFALFLYLGSL